MKNALPSVRVSSEFVIEIGAKNGSSVDIDPENIDELIYLLKHAKAWAEICRCSYPRAINAFTSSESEEPL